MGVFDLSQQNKQMKSNRNYYKYRKVFVKKHAPYYNYAFHYIKLSKFYKIKDLKDGSEIRRILLTSSISVSNMNQNTLNSSC